MQSLDILEEKLRLAILFFDRYRRPIFFGLLLALAIGGVVAWRDYAHRKNADRFVDEFALLDKQAPTLPAPWLELEKRFAALPESQWAEFKAWRLLLDEKKWPEVKDGALALYDKARDFDLKSLLLFFAASAAERGGDLKAAEGLLDRVLTQKGGEAYLDLARVEKARLLAQEANWEAAERELTALVESLDKRSSADPRLVQWTETLLVWVRREKGAL